MTLQVRDGRAILDQLLHLGLGSDLTGRLRCGPLVLRSFFTIVNIKLSLDLFIKRLLNLVLLSHQGMRGEACRSSRSILDRSLIILLLHEVALGLLVRCGGCNCGRSGFLLLLELGSSERSLLLGSCLSFSLGRGRSSNLSLLAFLLSCLLGGLLLFELLLSEHLCLLFSLLLRRLLVSLLLLFGLDQSLTLGRLLSRLFFRSLLFSLPLGHKLGLALSFEGGSLLLLLDAMLLGELLIFLLLGDASLHLLLG